MTEIHLSDHAKTAVSHESTLSRALGIIPYQPVTDTAHIFTFPEKAQHSFHTILVFQPLALLFLDDDTVVDTHTLQPFTTYTPSRACNAVIELNADKESNTVQPGDVIRNDL